jgi:hypothetical protein
MAVVVPVSRIRPDESRTIVIDKEDGLELQIHVRRPSLASQFQLDQYQDRLSFFWQKFFSVATAWEGVQEPDGTATPFNQENIERLCLYYPQTVRKLSELVNDLYYQDADDVLKNLPSPPPDGGTATATVTTVSTTPSDSGTSSRSESDAGTSSVPTSTN